MRARPGDGARGETQGEQGRARERQPRPASTWQRPLGSRAGAAPLADWKRRPGSFSRHRSTTWATCAGSSGGSGVGSLWRMAYPLSTNEPPGKARVPERSSWSTTPRLNRSDRASSGSPRTCSGDMYPGVPSTAPVRVAPPVGVTVASISPRGPASAAASASLAMPKSRSFTCRSGPTNTLSGFTSRWMTPRACAAASPRASCAPHSSAVWTGMRPRVIRWRSDSPSSSSVTKYGTPSYWPTS
jgi:hypothetical protein